MLTIDKIAVALKDRNLSEVARATGLSRSTVSAAAEGLEGVRYESVKRLSDYIEAEIERLQGAAAAGE